MKKPFFCLCALKPQTLRMNEEDPLHTSEESSQKYKGGEKKKEKIALFISFPPSFSLSHSPQGSIRK